MAEFLNKKKLLEWVPKLIESANKELIIVSPYIQVSQRIYDLLTDAEKRGVETTLIYKEGELSDKERSRFYEIGNLNLLFHPNLHSKCMYNEKYFLLTSMNLYEYSQKHNREMGVLFRRTDEESKGRNDYKYGKDDENIFQDAIDEIQSILNSSEFEKESFETKTMRFEMDIIKSKKDLAMEKCERYNKYSKNKKFTVFQEGEEWLCRCDNFTDGVDLIIENNRVSLSFNFEEWRILDIYSNLKTNRYLRNGDYRIVGCFRLFWTYHKSSPKLYPNANHATWAHPTDSNEFLEGYFQGLREVFKILKPELLRTKV
jgi:hypothetical protein